jgi:hypothetical protein
MFARSTSTREDTGSVGGELLCPGACSPPPHPHATDAAERIMVIKRIRPSVRGGKKILGVRGLQFDLTEGAGGQ